MKYVFGCIIFICLTNFSFCQNPHRNVEKIPKYWQINDGPYVLIEGGEVIMKTIQNGTIIQKPVSAEVYDTLYSTEPAIFETKEDIAVLSDIHGQFDLAIEILQNNKVIDENLNWSFGKGHFVIVGDIFDRGAQVNETLWFIYFLEKQAKEAGGMVHYLLGNHEFMVMMGDCFYVNDKYQTASQILGTDYDLLFGQETVLGRWLRSKPTIIKINDDLYVHGGISKDFIKVSDFEIENVNQVMRQTIDTSFSDLDSLGYFNTYHGDMGPIWYRGYFTGNLSDKEVTDILHDLETEHLVVGHCSNSKIVSLYNDRIFGVDSSIKRGKNGELLIIRGNRYKAYSKEGEQTEFGTLPKYDN